MKYREIEKKFYVEGGLSQPEVDYILHRELSADNEIYDSSTDYYYVPSNRIHVDFVRLRMYSNEKSEITVKKRDRGSNFNRFELNLEVEDGVASKKFCDMTFGKPVTAISKRYSVFQVGTVVVSTYVVEGYPQIFLEVEAVTESQVNLMVHKLAQKLKFTEEPKSLYDLFVKPLIPSTWGEVLIGGVN